MTAALAVAILTAGGVYLILQKGLVRVTLGFVLLGHAANLLLVAAGGMSRRGVPIIGWTDPALAADPLPQAFALTAIVITFGITVYLFGLSGAGADDLGELDDQAAEDDAHDDGSGRLGGTRPDGGRRDGGPGTQREVAE
jgi:multicomponent Na+:H+ antiporter subunit C